MPYGIKPYGINRGEFIPSESHWSVKKPSSDYPNVNAEVFFSFVFFILVTQAYLVPEGFLTLPVRLVWGAQRCFLLSEHSFCQLTVAEQRWCTVEELQPKTGYESACCSYSV